MSQSVASADAALLSAARAFASLRLENEAAAAAVAASTNMPSRLQRKTSHKSAADVDTSTARLPIHYPRKILLQLYDSPLCKCPPGLKPLSAWYGEYEAPPPPPSPAKSSNPHRPSQPTHADFGTSPLPSPSKESQNPHQPIPLPLGRGNPPPRNPFANFGRFGSEDQLLTVGSSTSSLSMGAKGGPRRVGDRDRERDRDDAPHLIPRPSDRDLPRRRGADTLGTRPEEGAATTAVRHKKSIDRYVPERDKDRDRDDEKYRDRDRDRNRDKDREESAHGTWRRAGERDRDRDPKSTGKRGDWDTYRTDRERDRDRDKSRDWAPPRSSRPWDRDRDQERDPHPLEDMSPSGTPAWADYQPSPIAQTSRRGGSSKDNWDVGDSGRWEAGDGKDAIQAWKEEMKAIEAEKLRKASQSEQQSNADLPERSGSVFAVKTAAKNVVAEKVDTAPSEGDVSKMTPSKQQVGHQTPSSSGLKRARAATLSLSLDAVTPEKSNNLGVLAVNGSHTADSLNPVAVPTGQSSQVFGTPGLVNMGTRTTGATPSWLSSLGTLTVPGEDFTPGGEGDGLLGALPMPEQSGRGGSRFAKFFDAKRGDTVISPLAPQHSRDAGSTDSGQSMTYARNDKVVLEAGADPDNMARVLSMLTMSGRQGGPLLPEAGISQQAHPTFEPRAVTNMHESRASVGGGESNYASSMTRPESSANMGVPSPVRFDRSFEYAESAQTAMVPPTHNSTPSQPHNATTAEMLHRIQHGISSRSTPEPAAYSKIEPSAFDAPYYQSASAVSQIPNSSGAREGSKMSFMQNRQHAQQQQMSNAQAIQLGHHPGLPNLPQRGVNNGNMHMGLAAHHSMSAAMGGAHSPPASRTSSMDMRLLSQHATSPIATGPFGMGMGRPIFAGQLPPGGSLQFGGMPPPGPSITSPGLGGPSHSPDIRLGHIPQQAQQMGGPMTSNAMMMPLSAGLSLGRHNPHLGIGLMGGQPQPPFGIAGLSQNGGAPPPPPPPPPPGSIGPVMLSSQAQHNLGPRGVTPGLFGTFGPHMGGGGLMGQGMRPSIPPLPPQHGFRGPLGSVVSGTMQPPPLPPHGLNMGMGIQSNGGLPSPQVDLMALLNAGMR